MSHCPSLSPFLEALCCRTHCLRSTQRLFRRFHACFPIYAHAADGLEALVRQDEDAAVVGFQVVDLLAEEQGPEVFADEFDAVEGCLRAWAVGAETMKCQNDCVSKCDLLSSCCNIPSFPSILSS